MKLPNGTPASVRKALHREKMMGKHFRKMELGVTELEQLSHRLSNGTELERSAAFENVSKRVLLERAAAARKEEK